jgi:ABC-type Fe3+ transport system substrate-binding protein
VIPAQAIAQGAGFRAAVSAVALSFFCLWPAAPVHPAESKPAWQAEWEKTLAVAYQEGEVTLYGQARSPTSDAMKAFQKAYPRIKLNFVGGTGNQLSPRVMAEKRAGKHLVDIAIGGPGTMVEVYYKAGLLEPIGSAFILPEVQDASLWWDRQHHFADADNRYVMAMTGDVSTTIGAYNSNLLKPDEIQSWWDLLRPKWRGRIVATDPKSAGNIQNWRYLYYSPELGPKFIRKLLAEMDVRFSSDERQMMDWLATGKYAVHLFAKGANLDQAIQQGLPVRELNSQKEAGSIGTGSGHIGFFKNAPHPNAARIYINWMLSREGQLNWQQWTKDNSLRVDIPKDAVPKGNIPIEGKKYMMLSSPEYEDVGGLKKLIDEVLSQAGRKL